MKAFHQSWVGRPSLALAVSLGWGLLAARRVEANDALNIKAQQAFVFAGEQLRVLADDVLVENNVFTDYTDTNGAWRTVKDSGNTIDLTVWTSGMVAGMFWYQYEATGDAAWKARAAYFTAGLEGVEVLDDNDLGFQVLNSFGLGYMLSDSAEEKDAYAARVLTGAESLHDLRYVSDIPAFWSWTEPKSRPEWLQAVNVDMIMNMEIMLWATEHGGPASYLAAVEGHAESTWIDIVRDDNSTFHVADYDPDTGDLVDQGTYQGYVDSSTWTRGQAWAIYGYAMIYRYLQEPKFLSMSLGLFQYWEDNIPSDLVPPTDFDAPVSASDNGKDASASAIVASALLEIFDLTEDAAYLVRAQEYMSSLLSADYYMPDATDGWQSILRRTSAKWSEPEVGSVTGDYFFLETMMRYKRLAPSVLLWEEAAVGVTAADSTVLYENENLNDDIDLSFLDATSSVVVWFSVTLGDTNYVPSSLSLASDAGDTVEASITEPSGGWVAGSNSASFPLPARALVGGKWNQVASLSIAFEASGPTASTTTTAAVNWLVVRQEGAVHEARRVEPCNIQSTVDAGDITTVTVDAPIYHTAVGDANGCDPVGCIGDLTRDGDLSSLDSRWSCKPDLGPAGFTCSITYSLAESLMLEGLNIAMYKGDTRRRTIDIYIDSVINTSWTSSGTTSNFENVVLGVSGQEIQLVAVLEATEWIAILEVEILVEDSDNESGTAC